MKFYNDEKFGYRNIKITTIIAKTVCFLNNKLFEKKKKSKYLLKSCTKHCIFIWPHPFQPAPMSFQSFNIEL